MRHNFTTRWRRTNSEYLQPALDFLANTKTELVVSFSHTGKHFPGDKEERDIYSVTLKNAKHVFMFPFGDSITNTREARITYRLKPDAYSILSCLTKYEPEDTLNNFAGSYGYTDNPEEAIRVYNAVKEEWANVSKLWTEEELQTLRDIS